MLRGLYTGASGMLAQEVRADVLANNLANANTVGFKREAVLQRAFPEMLLRRVFDPVAPGGGTSGTFFAGDGLYDPRPVIGRLGTGAYVDGTWTVHEQGPLRFTGNDLDVALEGDGFFAVQTAAGVRYTRDGRFVLDGAGRLVTLAGWPVLGVDGEPIVVGGGTAAIDEQGRVWVDGAVVGQLAVWAFPQPQWLQREGEGLWAPTEAAGQPVPGNATVHAGYVEDANVNVVTTMVELIEAYRSYEANSKVIQVYDETLGRVVNDLGRV